MTKERFLAVIFFVLLLLALWAYATDTVTAQDVPNKFSECVTDADGITDIVSWNTGNSVGLDILELPVLEADDTQELFNASTLIDIGVVVRGRETTSLREIFLLYYNGDNTYFEYRRDWRDSACLVQLMTVNLTTELY